MWMFNPSSDSLNNANLSFLLFFLTKLPVSFGLKDEHGSIAADWTRISSYWQTGEGLTHRSSHLLCLLSKKHWSVFFLFIIARELFNVFQCVQGQILLMKKCYDNVCGYNWLSLLLLIMGHFFECGRSDRREAETRWDQRLFLSVHSGLVLKRLKRRALVWWDFVNHLFLELSCFVFSIFGRLTGPTGGKKTFIHILWADPER